MTLRIDPALLPLLSGPDWAMEAAEENRALCVKEIGEYFHDCSKVAGRLQARLASAVSARWWRRAYLWPRGDYNSPCSLALPLLWHKWRPQGQTLRGWRSLRDQILSAIDAQLSRTQAGQLGRLATALILMSSGTELEGEDYALAQRVAAVEIRELPAITMPPAVPVRVVTGSAAIIRGQQERALREQSPEPQPVEEEPTHRFALLEIE